MATINDQLPTGDKEVIVEDVGDDLGVDNNKNPYYYIFLFQTLQTGYDIAGLGNVYG